ncbi:MAG: hypothetical protein ABSF26_01955 [Thermoguttaceae bacterium]|jgi:uncharacterized membrane protein YdcZ (DUF606 family)
MLGVAFFLAGIIAALMGMMLISGRFDSEGKKSYVNRTLGIILVGVGVVVILLVWHA